jgi:plastocyanin
MKSYGALIVLLLMPLFALAEDAPKPRPLNVGGIDAKDGGTITGVVRFKGTKPQPKPISDIAGNAFCKNCYKDGELPTQDSVVFGKNGQDDTLANVLVYVSKGLEGKSFEPPKEAVVLDQVGCVYTPHVVAVMAGQTLDIRNSDATLHNVMSTPRKNEAFNFGMPVKDEIVKKVFKEPEFKMNLRCFMHPWMSSYVHVLPHPFFAVTQGDGTFKIAGLPPGEYEVTVLQETSRFEPTPAKANVKVGAGETKAVDFTYQPRGAK